MVTLDPTLEAWIPFNVSEGAIIVVPAEVAETYC